MKIIRPHLLAIISLCILPHLAFAQTSDKIVANLSKLLEQLSNFDLYNKDDSLIDTINSQLDSQISFYIKSAPATLAQAFPKLGAVSSPDSVLSILAWDNQTGGTQRSFTNLFVYKANGRLNYVSSDTLARDGEFDHYYSEIFSLQVGNKTYYLITYKGILDSNEQMDGIQVFSIEDGKLNNEVKLIKTKLGFTYRLRYRYRSHIYGPGMTYEAKSKEISFPVIDKREHQADGKIVYKFNGRYFIRMKN